MKNKRGIAAAVIVILALLLIYRFYVVPKVLYPVKYSEYVDKYSEEYDVDKKLVYAVIKAESGFDASNRSRTGARGLMQIMPDTGKWAAELIEIDDYSPDMLYEPDTNIHIGCWYLRYLLDMYEDNMPTALAAYNAGLGNVSKWLADGEYSSDGNTLDNIPYGETEKYVEKTIKYMEKYDRYYDEF
ncbi:MAG: lytic transglycosylase domain-containing protein [Clostridia bacterium]|nr:lytic transglycosylase domain-containing protein [Clostridia bacterium]